MSSSRELAATMITSVQMDEGVVFTCLSIWTKKTVARPPTGAARPAVCQQPPSRRRPASADRRCCPCHFVTSPSSPSLLPLFACVLAWPHELCPATSRRRTHRPDHPVTARRCCPTACPTATRFPLPPLFWPSFPPPSRARASARRPAAACRPSGRRAPSAPAAREPNRCPAAAAAAAAAAALLRPNCFLPLFLPFAAPVLAITRCLCPVLLPWFEISDFDRVVSTFRAPYASDHVESKEDDCTVGLVLLPGYGED
ncbi:hypothetical protein NL676_001794 [Syzygium grande]|nr:hypothetical protein NL676_001794 [Syzygium grande]